MFVIFIVIIAVVFVVSVTIASSVIAKRYKNVPQHEVRW